MDKFGYFFIYTKEYMVVSSMDQSILKNVFKAKSLINNRVECDCGTVMKSATVKRYLQDSHDYNREAEFTL